MPDGGVKLKQAKRLLTTIITICLIIGCFLPSQSYALSKKVTTNNQTNKSNEVILKQKSQDTEADKADKSKKADETDKAKKVNETNKSDKEDKSDKSNKSDQEVNNTTDDQTTKSGNNVTTTSPKISAPSTQVEGEKNDDNAKNEHNTNDETDTKDKDDTKDKNDTEDEEKLWYSSQNLMKKEHQKLLWEYCKKREVDYIDMLALIYTESGFDEKCSTGKYYGYFQISKGNCANLAATLKTKNKPFDGAININWGTYMYGEILADKRVKDLEGKKQRDVALSIYQRGTGGYDKYGISTKFLKVFYAKRDKVCGWFEENDQKT